MSALSYQEFKSAKGVPVKAWIKGVPIEEEARRQLEALSELPIIFRHVAVMPDVHVGIGATIGSVVPTVKAIIPAAVGVDLGCGMMAVKTSLSASDLPENLEGIRNVMEIAVPHGRTTRGKDRGSWGTPPQRVEAGWAKLKPGFDALVEKHPRLGQSNNLVHLGTLGTGNHFVELCLDEAQAVWIMLHSGSRGVGNAIGRHFIEKAKKDMANHLHNLPDKDLAYFEEGSAFFGDYVAGVTWAQAYARMNREIMMQNLLVALREKTNLPPFQAHIEAVNCHHNYVQKERHFGEEIWVTRKGAVRAGKGEMGIIPGSMGACSFIVRGLGNAESFESCSHGAGRVMSRTKAKKLISLEAHAKATEGVSCRKDEGVLDESPAAYKPIEAVMAAQKDLVEIVYQLKQVVCVKG